MKSCCAVPVETIAADKHKKNDTCCLVTDIGQDPATASCPVSGTSSRRVQRRTLEHLLKPEVRDGIEEVQYYYCNNPDCDVVYFSPRTDRKFRVEDLLVKVFAKDDGEDVNVCYCYDWTRQRIRKEIEETGSSTASMAIAREVKAGSCTCDVTNPKGECCLGDVNLFVKSVVQSSKDT